MELEFDVDEFNRIFPPVIPEFPCFCLLTAALAAAMISAALRGTLAFAASLLFPLETGETVPPIGLGFELAPPMKMSNRFKNKNSYNTYNDYYQMGSELIYFHTNLSQKKHRKC